MSKTTTVNETSGTAIVLNKPSEVVEGNLIIAYIGVGASAADGTISPPDGSWTEIFESHIGRGSNGAAFYKFAGASEPATYTFTWTGATRSRGALMRFENVSAVNLPAVTQGFSANAFAHVAPSIVAGANAGLLCFANPGWSGTTTTPPASMSPELYDVTNSGGSSEGGSLSAGFELVEPGATGTRTFTSNQSVWRLMASVTLTGT